MPTIQENLDPRELAVGRTVGRVAQWSLHALLKEQFYYNCTDEVKHTVSY